MKVLITTLGAGPAGIRVPGQRLDLDDAEAAALIAAGAASAIAAPAVEITVQPERAVVPAAPELERAVAPAGKHKKTRR